MALISTNPVTNHTHTQQTPYSNMPILSMWIDFTKLITTKQNFHLKTFGPKSKKLHKIFQQQTSIDPRTVILPTFCEQSSQPPARKVF